MPATLPVRRRTSTRRKLPALRGMFPPMLLKTPINDAVRAQASVRLSPHGSASTLSRRSTTMRPSFGFEFDGRDNANAIFRRTGNRIVRA